MAANLRRGNLPTETTMARFMYYIIKQLDVRGVSNLFLASFLCITSYLYPYNNSSMAVDLRPSSLLHLLFHAIPHINSIVAELKLMDLHRSTGL